jgi:hypothetical protein
MRARPERNIIESKGHAHRISVLLTRNMCVNLARSSEGRDPRRAAKDQFGVTRVGRAAPLGLIRY